MDSTRSSQPIATAGWRSPRACLAWLASTLLLALAGCALARVAPSLVSPAGPASLEVGRAYVPAQTSLALPAGKGLLEIAVRWPARNGQVIPDSTSRVRFDLATAGGSFVASASISRPGGASTSTASFELDAGPYKLDAAAQTGPAGAPTTVATASAPFTVVGGARIGLPLTLGASYRPAVTGFDKAWGFPGESVTLSGSNLSLSWAATPSVTFSAAGASVSAVLDTVESASVRFTIPSGAITGPVSVAVDGVTTDSATFTVPDPALWALSTPLASAGDTLYLDGGFGQSATVTFPGNQTVAADVLGPGRAKVAVPAGATAGNLTITTGGTSSAPLAFRAPTFSLGLGTLFGRHYDQADIGRQWPALQTARAGLGGAVIGRYVYAIGGTDGTLLTSVERAVVDAAGNLGPFEAVSGVTLVTGRYGFASAVIGSYLYVAGGNGGGALASVERAPIDGSGNLGTFETVSGVTLPSARYYVRGAVIGRYFYVVGGYTGSTYLAAVERAAIDGAGNLGPFVTVPGVVLGTPRHSPGMVRAGGYLYVLGGRAAAGNLDTSERAPIDGAGNLGAFTTTGASNLTAARRFPAAVVAGNRVYVIGGTGSPSYLNSAERASFDGAGNLGAFETIGATLATARLGFGTAIAGNHLYVIGGQGTPGVYLKDVERIAVNTSGGLTTFTTAAATLAAGRTAFTTAVVRNRAFLIGGIRGATYLDTVEQADVDVAGNLGSFTTSPGVNLAVARYGLTSAVAGNYVYAVGGWGTGGVKNTVDRALIQADGSLGSFSLVSGVGLGTARYGHAQAIVGNYLYITGGTSDGTNALTSVERATIGTGGDLGTFSNAGIALQAVRRFHSTAIVGNYLYVLGGGTPTAATSVERASIAANGDLGAFSSAGVPPLAVARTGMTAAVVGDYLYLFAGQNSGMYAEVQRALISSSGDLGSFSVVSGVTAATAVVNSGLVLLGNQIYILGGSKCCSTEIADIQRALLQ
ncbi:MAG: hypothetical protein FJZ01_18970 [Candidatus Sericytochromatia bacterium]|nr:hypothetical protein [Candidatus Tanganyikabacteria bacterium]